MANREMTSQEARDEWAALVAGAEHRGETTIITRYGKPVAAVGPAPGREGHGPAGQRELLDALIAAYGDCTAWAAPDYGGSVRRVVYVIDTGNPVLPLRIAVEDPDGTLLDRGVKAAGRGTLVTLATVINGDDQ